MSSMLIFYVGLDPSAPIRWARVIDAALAEHGTVDHAGEIGSISGAVPVNDKIIAILHGEQVAFRTLASPPRNAKKFQVAAQYLLEDELGDSVDDLHIATGTADRLGLALAIKTSIIADWCDRFLEHGVDLDVMVPDYLCLPVTPEGIFVLFDSGRTIASSASAGFAVENQLADAVLPEFIAENPGENISTVGERTLVTALLPANIDYLGPAESGQLLTLFAEGYTARTPPNLLQGRFRKRREWKSDAAVWRRAGMIAAAAGVAFIVLSVVQGLRANQVAAKYQASAEALHRQSFPDATDTDPGAHARAILSAGGGGANFLTISSRIDAVLDEIEAVDIDRIRYDGARRQYVISIMSETDGDIEVFRRGLAAQGVSAEDSGGYRRAGDIWIGDMTVSTR